MEQERLMILKMLEEGKITAEEAAELLSAVEDSVTEVRAAGASSEGEAREQDGPRRRAAGDWEARLTRGAEAVAEGAERLAARMVERIPSVLEGFETWFQSLGLGFGEPYRFESVLEGTFGEQAQAPRVVLRTYNGRVEVRTWERDQYRLELVKTVRARDEAHARQAADGMGRVTQGAEFIAVEMGEHARGGMGITCWLPARLLYDLEVHTSNGRIEVRDLRAGTLRLKTSNGRVEVAGGEADRAQIRTSNGRIVLAGPCGEAEAQTSNGRIVLAPPGGARTGRYRLETSNGPIRVRLAEGVPVSLDLRTSLGRIHVGVEGIVYETQERRPNPRVVGSTPGFRPGSGVEVQAGTSNGSIRIGHQADADDDESGR